VGLAPRWLAILGLIGIALQFTGVTLPMFAGYPTVSQMAMPMGPIQLLAAVWLMVKGFDERGAAVRSESAERLPA
jgi:hypothetical protein